MKISTRAVRRRVQNNGTGHDNELLKFINIGKYNVNVCSS
jgi:hypothetical protein